MNNNNNDNIPGMVEVTQPQSIEGKSAEELIKPLSIAQWIYLAIGEISGLHLRTRLRGNDLHILCESNPCPEMNQVIPLLLKALIAEDGKIPHTNPEHTIYKFIVYGREIDAQRPQWIEALHLNQLDKHLENWPEENAPSRPKVKKESSLVISTENLARSGTPEAIARYLSEILSPMGVGVKVMIQLKVAQPQETEPIIPSPEQIDQQPLRRIWIICDADYSPDPALIAEPIAERLRKLELQGFQDAIITNQVSGENQTDWRLRIDLTPKEEMLKNWARWGDLEAISRLINYELEVYGLEIRTILKETTLHLFCSRNPRWQNSPIIPDKSKVIHIVAPLLESIAPQGIHRATIYGVKFERSFTKPDDEKPVWIELLNLPASIYEPLADTPINLAQQGDQEALLFLLHRVIHKDIDWRLITGGIQIIINKKHDLLHLMTEAPICPQKNQIAPALAKFIRQLRLPKIAGIRIYGRRAGESKPFWSYGVDFIKRTSINPQPTPQFAVTKSWDNHDLTVPVAEKEQTPGGSSSTIVEEITPIYEQTLGEQLQNWLLSSQLFLPTSTETNINTISSNITPVYAPQINRRIAIVWGILGILFTLQSDWLIGQILQNYTANRVQVESNKQPIIQPSPPPEVVTNTVPIPEINLQQKHGNQNKGFNNSGFTKTGDNIVIVNNDIARRPRATTDAMLAAARSNNATFNNRLLDEKIALYQQRIIKNGGIAPDVLIVGSSRAMRGIDPTILQKSLAKQGYSNIQIFNMGINGATVQVVDIIIRRILAESQLPKIVIWADGARAFNSNRTDTTYNSIKSSPGYQELELAKLPNSSPTSQTEKPKQEAENNNPSFGTSTINKLLNDNLAKLSATYSQRQQMKGFFIESLTSITKDVEENIASVIPQNQQTPNQPRTESEKSAYAIDFDGYLPINVRFDPKTYYQQYAKVTGDYDSDYDNFKISGIQEDALLSLIDFLHEKNISLVFVNTPMTKEYLDQIRHKHEQEFLEYMQEISRKKGIILKDLSLLFPEQNDYFSDPSHLNQYGAYQVSLKLAQDITISWPK